MLVSIVVNNHNYGPYLRAAIDSALAQTYEPMEVIVVDSGSTDNSREIIAEYGDRIVSILKDAEGQAATCNAGILRSRGDVVFLLDSDDVLYPDIAAHAAEVFSSDAEVAWVQFRLEVIDQGGAPAGVVKPPGHLPRRSGDLRRYVLACPFDVTRMATSGNAFAAAALEHLLPIPETVYRPAGVDWYLCPLAALFGRVVFLDTIGGGYRLHGANSNWYERPCQVVDLVGIRRDLELMTATAAYIHTFARQAGLQPPREITSVCYVANRLLSLKLDPASHPISGDTLWRLLVLGALASLRRFDVHWCMRLMFMGWFALVALAPRSLVQVLAEFFLFPNKRGVLNPLLARLHTPSPVTATLRR